MDTITLLFTCRRWNPVSWLIRWVMPRSRFALALSSHCIILADGRYFEADMFAGVREIDRDTALRNHTVVRQRDYFVPSAAAGIAWILGQLCTYQSNPPAWLPAWARRIYAIVDLLINNNYDWRGALGLGLAPDRQWASDFAWFCYELAAGFIAACGRPVFANLSNVGETALLAIES
jgi:hypothetical protein